MMIDGDMEGVVNEGVDPSAVNLVVHEVPEVRWVLFCEIFLFILLFTFFLYYN